MRTEGLAPEIISRSNAAQAAYWSLAQLVTHHTVNGCALSAGDLFGSGTLSGSRPEQAGSLLELTVGGKQAITLGNGERRTFLEDGDSITLRGRCTRTGFQSIGFGECTASVLPPLGAI
jgi:fumarylacetoacetase